MCRCKQNWLCNYYLKTTPLIAGQQLLLGLAEVLYSGKFFKGENFRRSVGSENFTEKTFTDFLKPNISGCSMPQNFIEKTFADGSRTSKFTKVFSLESFPLYSMCTKVMFSLAQWNDKSAGLPGLVACQNASLCPPLFCTRPFSSDQPSEFVAECIFYSVYIRKLIVWKLFCV